MICGNIVQIKPIIHEWRSRLLITHRTTLLYALGAQNIGGGSSFAVKVLRVIARISILWTIHWRHTSKGTWEITLISLSQVRSNVCISILACNRQTKITVCPFYMETSPFSETWKRLNPKKWLEANKICNALLDFALVFGLGPQDYPGLRGLAF